MPETTGESEVPESRHVGEDFEPPEDTVEGPEQELWFEDGVLKLLKKYYDNPYLAVYETPTEARHAYEDGKVALEDDGKWEDGYPAKERCENLREMADEFEERIGQTSGFEKSCDECEERFRVSVQPEGIHVTCDCNGSLNLTDLLSDGGHGNIQDVPSVKPDSFDPGFEGAIAAVQRRYKLYGAGDRTDLWPAHATMFPEENVAVWGESGRVCINDESGETKRLEPDEARDAVEAGTYPGVMNGYEVNLQERILEIADEQEDAGVSDEA